MAGVVPERRDASIRKGRRPDPVQVALPCKRGRGEEQTELGKKLYVGNIPFNTTESELRALFERHGTVGSVNVITDRETGRPRGFAFVEMDDANAAETAMRALDGSQLGGRSLRVNEAQDRRSGGGGGGGGGFRREGGGGGGGFRRDRY
jgi:RNA recognition motif-containing protein